jgi:hypothetical protein
MKAPRAVLKVAAATSSALLIAGFVGYRAGAFDGLAKSGPDTSFPDGCTLILTNDAPQEPTSVVDPAMLSGSKSAIYIVPVQPPAKDGSVPAPKGPPTFIGGSKSLAPLVPPVPPKSPAPADPK